MEVKKLEEKLRLLEDKIDALDTALILETDAARKFQYKKEIEESERKKEEILRALSAKYDISSPAGAAALTEKVRQLAFSGNIGLLGRLNCDRTEMMARFWNCFERLPASGFQFYFVSSCPTQMPHCFSERAVIEILIEELEDALDALYVRRHPEDERLELFGLPAGRNLQKSQQAFGKFFARYFEQRDDARIGQLFSRALSGKRYEYAAIIFRLYERDWKDSHPAYLQWIIDTLSGLKIFRPRFLIFFVNYLEGLHHGRPDERQSAIVNTFQQLADSNPSAAHLSPLRPVVEIDLKTWLHKLGEANPTKVEGVIEALVRGLPPEDKKQYEMEKLLNMDDIDLLQEVVFQVANE